MFGLPYLYEEAAYRGNDELEFYILTRQSQKIYGTGVRVNLETNNTILTL